VLVAASVLLRIVKGLPHPEPRLVHVAGLGDFALRREHFYGTVPVDLDAHRRVGLLPERTAEPVTRWLSDHPGTVVIRRA